MVHQDIDFPISVKYFPILSTSKAALLHPMKVIKITGLHRVIINYSVVAPVIVWNEESLHIQDQSEGLERVRLWVWKKEGYRSWMGREPGVVECLKFLFILMYYQLHKMAIRRIKQPRIEQLIPQG